MDATAQRKAIAHEIRKVKRKDDVRMSNMPRMNQVIQRKNINECARLVFLGDAPPKPNIQEMLERVESLRNEYAYRIENRRDLCPQVCGEDDAWWETTDWLLQEAQQLRNQVTKMIR